MEALATISGSFALFAGRLRSVTIQSAALRYLLVTSLLLTASFLLVGVFRRQLYFVLGADSFLTVHTTVEIISIAVSVSIFGFGWFTYAQSRNNYALFLALVFLGIAILDFMHTLSFMGMPSFITPSSTDKAVQYWIAARLFGAIAFLIGAFIPSVPVAAGKKPLPKKMLLASVLIACAGMFIWVSYFRVHSRCTSYKAPG